MDEHFVRDKQFKMFINSLNKPAYDITQRDNIVEKT